MELDERASGVGLGVRRRTGPIFCNALCAYLLGVFNACFVGAAKRVEPIARERVLCPNPADLGAGPVYSIQRFGAVARLVVALYRVVLCHLAFDRD